MRKTWAMVLTLVMFTLFFTGCENNKLKGEYRVALITDMADVNDHSINQQMYTACRFFTEQHNMEFRYYKPGADSDDARLTSVDSAVADGYNIIFMPGFKFVPIADTICGENPNVEFVIMDVTTDDFPKDYVYPKNLRTLAFNEEYAGFMAGYAAVKEGYTKLGFLGGIAVPGVMKFGYGYLAGIDYAVKELDIKDVEVKYVYGGKFAGDPEITAQMETWLSGGTQVIFSCGGLIFTSVCEAIAKYGGKIIGVDVDQADEIDGKYNRDMCITSAMKGMDVGVYEVLSQIISEGFGKGGTAVQKGVISLNPEENYVQLPMKNWKMKNFTVDDYKKLVKDIFNKKITYEFTDKLNPDSLSFKLNMYANIH